MSVASLNGRLSKLTGEGQSLDWWAERYRRDGAEVPDHILISLVAGRMIPKHLANAVFDHPDCVAWRDNLEARVTPFPDWLASRGASVDTILDEVKRAR
jgi:hypothetical protein